MFQEVYSSVPGLSVDGLCEGGVVEMGGIGDIRDI